MLLTILAPIATLFAVFPATSADPSRSITDRPVSSATLAAITADHRFYLYDITTFEPVSGVPIHVTFDSTTYSASSDESGVARITLPSRAKVVDLEVSNAAYLALDNRRFLLREKMFRNTVPLHPRSIGYTSRLIDASSGGTVSMPNGARITIDRGDLAADCHLRIIEVPGSLSYWHTLDAGSLLAHVHIESVDRNGDPITGAIVSELEVTWPSIVDWASVSAHFRAWHYDPATDVVTEASSASANGSNLEFPVVSGHTMIRGSRTYTGACTEYEHKIELGGTTLPAAADCYGVADIRHGTSFGNGVSYSMSSGSTKTVTTTSGDFMEAEVEASALKLISAKIGGCVTREDPSTISTVLVEASSGTLPVNEDLGAAYHCFDGKAHVGRIHRVATISKRCKDPLGPWELVETYAIPSGIHRWYSLTFNPDRADRATPPSPLPNDYDPTNG